eukprot:5946737-Heterocapsa_arctica.AAC.1
MLLFASISRDLMLPRLLRALLLEDDGTAFRHGLLEPCLAHEPRSIAGRETCGLRLLGVGGEGRQ